jgi:hypothetical protein
MKDGFTPVPLKDYLDDYIDGNPDEDPTKVAAALQDALRAFHSGKRCQCGNPLWVVGSAIAGHACFTCITGEAEPHGDFEIDEACTKVDLK